MLAAGQQAEKRAVRLPSGRQPLALQSGYRGQLPTTATEFK